MANTATGREQYLERLLHELRARFADVEQVCRRYEDQPDGLDARSAMKRCSEIVDEPDARRLVADIDAAFEPSPTPRWSD